MTAIRVDQPPKRERSRPSAGATRAAFAVGMDMGTLRTPTAEVVGGVARSLADVELRGIIRYGLPTEHETVETDRTESVARDFGALELRACYGTGVRVRLSACGGGEVGVVRVTRRLMTEAVDVDESSTTPRLSGVLAALVGHRGGVVQPELELSGVAVALGRQGGAPPVVLRVAAGAAVEF